MADDTSTSPTPSRDGPPAVPARAVSAARKRGKRPLPPPVRKRSKIIDMRLVQAGAPIASALAAADPTDEQIRKALEGQELANIEALKKLRDGGGIAASQAIKMLQEILGRKRAVTCRQLRVSFAAGAS
jgi:hypothetical protein